MTIYWLHPCQVFDGDDRYELLSGSYARKLARQTKQESRINMRHVSSNVCSEFVERAYRVVHDDMKTQFMPGRMHQTKFVLKGRRDSLYDDFRYAACSGTVLALVRDGETDMLHAWQMGDALWAVLRWNNKRMPPVLECVKLSEPLYDYQAAFCGTRDYVKQQQQFERKERAIPPVCRCEKCDPLPKRLKYSDESTLRDAIRDGTSFKVEDGDVVIMGMCTYVCCQFSSLESLSFSLSLSLL
jgi:hypothetical protein